MPKRTLIRTIAAVSLAALAIFVAACGGDDAGEDIVLTITPSAVAASPTAAPATDTPAPPDATPDLGGMPSSGVVQVDRVISAIARGDALSLENQVLLSLVACRANPPQGAGGPPKCRAGEADGSNVQVFPVAQCEGSYARPDEIDVGRWPYEGSELYAAYRTPSEFFPPGPWAIVYRRTDGMAAGLAWLIVVTDDDSRGGEGIVGVNFGCGETPEQLISSQRLTQELIPPQ